MKKVLLSAYACIPGRGSEAGNGWNWALFLSQAGFEVHVLTNSRGRKEITEAFTKENIQNLHIHYVDHSIFWEKAYYWNFIFMYLAYFLWQKKILKKAILLHQEHNFQIVHHVTWASIKIGTSLFKLENTKLIFGPVGGGHKAPEKFKEYFFNEWKKEWIRNRIGSFISLINPLTKPTLQKSFVVLVANQETKEYAIRNGSKNVVLTLDSAIQINNENHIAKTSHTQKKMQLLWVGRMYAFKGLGLVIDAISSLDQKIKDGLHLDVVGGGPFLDEAKKLVRKSNLEDIITLHGQVPFSDVSGFYKRADIFILCSLRDSFGSQILEATSYGLPIITLNLNGVKTFLPETCAIKVPAIEPIHTVAEIAQAINTLVNNENLRLKMGVEAYKFASMNTWKVKVENIVSRYYN